MRHKNIWVWLAVIAALVCLNAIHSVHEGVINFDIFWAHLANSVLKISPTFAACMGHLNTRVGDVFVILVLCTIFCMHAFKTSTLEEACRRLSFWLWVGLLCLTTYAVVCLFDTVVPRPIPLAALPELIDVRKLYDVKLHTSAMESFPSGHALAYILFMVMAWQSSYRRVGAMLAVVGAIMLSQRWMLGVHWFSDIIFGSLPLAFLIAAVAKETPVRRTYDLVNTQLTNIAKRFFPSMSPAPLASEADSKSKELTKV